jgi:hypothetical protein
MSAARDPRRRSLLLALASVLVLVVGCSMGSGTLGGREKCWPESHRRAASVWRGILRIDTRGGRLDTPEGDVIPLLPGALSILPGATGGELVRGSDVVARAGDDVTLFGGAGADGALVVCAVEENRGPS